MATVAQVPDWNVIWSAYYDYINFPDSNDVKRRIGGAVDAAWIKNTCAVRLSDAFNYSGLPVPRRFDGLKTVRDGGGSNIAFRVAELRKWMLYRLGKPDIMTTKKANDPFDKSAITNKKGIIEFAIAFSDATGHLDLWDGSTFSSEAATSRDYWKSATKINLWECGK